MYIEVHTRDVRKLEGIKKKKELRARTVPSIAVNGEVLFQSGIPQQDELSAAILLRWLEKGQLHSSPGH